MPGRLYDEITDPVLERCQGCGQSTLMCECNMERGAKCCGVCTHHHSLHTLALYGLLEK